MNKRTLFLCHTAAIAALYVTLTYFSAIMGIASGAVQVRLSEALCVLPFFTSAAVPGLTLGCLLANLLFGVSVYDIIFGTLATLIGAVGARACRKYKWLVPLPTIASNTIIIPLMLYFSGLTEDGLPFMMLTVGLGEVISVGILGMILLFALKRYEKHIFK